MPMIQGTAVLSRRGGCLVPRSPLSYLRPPPLARPEEGCLMMTDNIFLKIIQRQIPAKIAYEDDQCLAFHDRNPQAPVHVLLVPKKVIPTHADVTEADKQLLGHLHIVA